MELEAEHETGETHPWLSRLELLSDLWTGHPYHSPIQLLRYSRCLGHRDTEGHAVPGESGLVLCTELGPPSCTHWYRVSLILSTPIWSSLFQSQWLEQISNSLGKSNSVRSGIEQRDGNRHVRWELLRRCSEGSGGINSQVSPAWRPTASDTG